MKNRKLFLSFLITVFVCSMAFGQTITVTSPNGGENWVNGTPQNITWTSSGITSGTFTVLLFDGTTKVGTIQTGTPCTDGVHSIPWTVGTLAGGVPVPSGCNYRVKVRQTSLAPNDYSDASFFISGSAGPPSISVTSPNGGENWQIGGPNKNITWTSSGIASGQYKITLWNGDTNIGVIASNISYSTHSFNWQVGKLSNGTTVATGLNYRVKVRVISEAPMDFSNNFFGLSSTPAVEPSIPFEVYKPVFKQVCKGGFPLEIRWRNKLLIKQKYSAHQKTVQGAMPHKVLFRNVKIQIKSVSCPKPPELELALRNMYGQIVPKLKELEIKALLAKPWLMEILQWNTLIESTPDDGSYFWKVPIFYKKGCYKIRVTKLHGSKLKAESKVFYIVPAKLQGVIGFKKDLVEL